MLREGVGRVGITDEVQSSRRGVRKVRARGVGGVRRGSKLKNRIAIAFESKNRIFLLFLLFVTTSGRISHTLLGKKMCLNVYRRDGGGDQKEMMKKKTSS